MSAVEIDEKRLERLGRRYNVPSLVSNLTEYLETEGSATTESLPSWDEFQDLASQYEVTV
jgi:hypothetical protein